MKLQCAELDAFWDNVAILSALGGISVAIKDSVHIKHYPPPLFGNYYHAMDQMSHWSAYNDSTVAALCGLGMIILDHSVMTESGMKGYNVKDSGPFNLHATGWNIRLQGNATPVRIQYGKRLYNSQPRAKFHLAFHNTHVSYYCRHTGKVPQEGRRWRLPSNSVHWRRGLTVGRGDLHPHILVRGGGIGCQPFSRSRPVQLR